MPAHPADLQALAVSQVRGIFLRCIHWPFMIYAGRAIVHVRNENSKGTHENLISRRDWDGRAETAIDMKNPSRIFR